MTTTTTTHQDSEQATATLELLQAITSKAALLDDGAAARTTSPSARHVNELDASREHIGDAHVSALAEHILAHDHDQAVWQERPSQALLLAPLFKWLFVLALVFLALGAYRSSIEKAVGPAISLEEWRAFISHKTEAAEAKGRAADALKAKFAQEEAVLMHRSTQWGQVSIASKAAYAMVILAVLALVKRLLQNRCTSYRLSSQRLFIRSGILSRTEVPIEVHRLSNATIHQPFLLRLGGASNLHFNGLSLWGLRNPEVVRDLIRTAGQLEAQRADKFRYR